MEGMQNEEDLIILNLTGFWREFLVGEVLEVVVVTTYLGEESLCWCFVENLESWFSLCRSADFG